MKKMEGERPHRSGSSSSELFICFTSRPSSSSNTSSMKISSKSILSPGRTDKLREGVTTLPSSLSRRLRSNGSMKGGQSSPMFPTGSKKKGCAFETPEPSSPKVTCIGQVRVKTKKQGKKMRTRSKRRGGDGSFRKTEQIQEGQMQQQQECLPNRNQRWVHLPLSICEALRAFGAEFNCFVPCGGRSSCSSSNAGMEREKGEKRAAAPAGGTPPTSSCGAVFAKWLMALQESEEGKRREIGGEMVGIVGAEDEEEKERVEEKKGEEKAEVEIEEEDEEVNVCIPPRNALLLMRCRSEPLRMSSLANRFWDSPAQKEEENEDRNEEEEDEDDDEEEHDYEEAVEEEQQIEGEAEQKEDETLEKAVSAEEHENTEEEEEEYGEAQEQKEADEEEGVENGSSGVSLEEQEKPQEDDKGKEEAQLQKQEEEGEGEKEEEETQLHKTEEEEKETQLQKIKEERETQLQKTEEVEKEIQLQKTEEEEEEEEEETHLQKTKEEQKETQLHKTEEGEEEEEEEEEREEKMVEERRSSSCSTASVQLEKEEEGAEAVLEEERSTEEENEKTEVITVETTEAAAAAATAAESEEEKSTVEEERKVEGREERESALQLPDCLLLMMCEPKLSMEVSRETWVCSTDFLRCRPDKGPAPPPPPPPPPEATGKRKEGAADDSKRVSTDSNPAHPPPANPTPQQPLSMATVIEQKLVNAVAYEPFVLTRCKSEPVRSSARLAPEACFWKSRKLPPHQPPVGVGAAGVGF